MKSILAVILMVLVGLAWFGTLETAQAEGNSALSEDEKQRILQATVRIKMSVVGDGKNRIEANGLGSVVMLDGKTVVVTHNHWEQLLDQTITVTFRAADRTLITTLTGKAFYGSILYQDAGTIIFKAPGAVLEYLRMAKIEVPEAVVGKELAPGTRVWSAYFPGKVGAELDVRAMVIETGNEAQQPPVYRLHSQNGKPNQQGDSGGGIWCDGKLVGNMWAVVMETAPEGGWQSSSVSDAAVLHW